MWDDIHKSREWGRYPKEELVRFVIKNYDSKKDAVFLDLGCGSGASTWFLDNEGFEVAAIDASSHAIARLKGKMCWVDARVADATALPYRPNTFDCVIDIVCTAHNDPQDAIKIVSEINRVLKPDGKLFSMMPTWKTDRRPFEGKGNAIFLDLPAVQALFEPLFELKVGFSEFTDNITNGQSVANWVIEATKR